MVGLSASELPWDTLDLVPEVNKTRRVDLETLDALAQTLGCSSGGLIGSDDDGKASKGGEGPGWEGPPGCLTPSGPMGYGL